MMNDTFEGSSSINKIFQSPQSGCQHKAWGEAQRNPRIKVAKNS
jgi:hypothetical protein